MARKNIIKIDISQVINFRKNIQNCSSLVQGRLASAMERWASETKNDYDVRTGYGSGLKGNKSFYIVEASKKTDGLYVAVGHESFIARFLEVGTKAHTIRHIHGTKIVVANVKGIKGSKALGKAFNARRKKIADLIQKEINDILKGG